jgi:tetratricopeptide (TPR) repeat protein
MMAFECSDYQRHTIRRDMAEQKGPSVSTTIASAKEESNQLQLPPAPAMEKGVVKAWEEPVILPSYMPAAPDRNPLFLEKRVYQGSSGRVYPLPVIDRVDSEPSLHSWKAVHIENEAIRLMILPEIGGRIHVGYDKLNDYDFFYRQNVIKPALVGLAGPWISGGVEFNWPQHHRPATFMPVEVTIERDDDGSITVWCSDHDPMVRMKGMHGLCLHPGKAYLELKVRLYNRTQDTQTFLWWANVATRVHEKYQSFFPTDVRFVADHAKRAITEFPLSRGTYYGIDYGKRAVDGVPEHEKPAEFVPDGSYSPNDLSWYANIPVPTSYMVANSKGDFSGGYDHAARAGMVHFANHHISPGKKQWTWGNHEFGYAWDRSLTDSDGPYIELMSGVYTDNQPDFSFLAPGETKTFSQFWYPIREIGVPDIANLDAALRLERHTDKVTVHLLVTRDIVGAIVRLKSRGQSIAEWRGDLKPDHPLHSEFPILESEEDLEFLLKLDDGDGEVLLRYAPSEIVSAAAPTVATEPGMPDTISSNDELYLIGLHLEQYRHATRSPEDYWLEAIRRDPGDSRSNHALGRWFLRRGEFANAEQHLRIAIARMTERNPNPYDGEPHYNLGLALGYQGKISEAYAAYYKSTWNAAWRGPAHHRLAELDCGHRQWKQALEHIERSLAAEADNLNARNLKSVILRRLARNSESDECIRATRKLDPLDNWSRYLSTRQIPQNGQQRLDLGLDLMRANLFDEALSVLHADSTEAADGSRPMLLYAFAHVYTMLGQHDAGLKTYRAAALANADYVFPNRLDELVLLKAAMDHNPSDPRAPYYLGNLLYDRRRHEEAIHKWERAAELDPDFPTTWRNLGFAYYNVRGDLKKARSAFEHARALAPNDARLMYEQDQLLKRSGERPAVRLEALEAEAVMVAQRDDLSVELASLYNQVGRPADALTVLLSRRFQPWEGGEGLVLSQYVRANLLLGQKALADNDTRSSIQSFEAAWNVPQSLSEAKHLLMNLSMIDYWLGVAYSANEDRSKAIAHWNRAARQRGDFQQMQVQSISDMTYWSAQALLSLGRVDEANSLFQGILDYSVELEQAPVKIDYFATSLPTLLLFEEDLVKRKEISAKFLRAQALAGLGRTELSVELLNEVLSLDQNHSAAMDLLITLEMTVS